MLVSQGYPEAYEKGKVMTQLDEVKDSILFHAGTKRNEQGQLISNGGRVLAVTSFGSNIAEALEISKRNAAIIQFENKYYRKDIGYEFI